MTFNEGYEIQANECCHKALVGQILTIKKVFNWGVIATANIPYKGKINYRLRHWQYRIPIPVECDDEEDEELFVD